MRFISIITVFYFIITVVFARNIFSQSNFSFTIKPALSLSVPFDDSGPNQAQINQSAAPGFSIGVFAGFDIGKYLKLITGLDWKRKVALYTNTYYDEEASSYTTIFIQDAVDQLGITFLLSYYAYSQVNIGWYWSGGFSLDIFL